MLLTSIFNHQQLERIKKTRCCYPVHIGRTDDPSWVLNCNHWRVYFCGSGRVVQYWYVCCSNYVGHVGFHGGSWFRLRERERERGLLMICLPSRLLELGTCTVWAGLGGKGNVVQVNYVGVFGPFVWFVYVPCARAIHDVLPVIRGRAAGGWGTGTLFCWSTETCGWCGASK